MTAQDRTSDGSRNEVRLRGRVAQDPVARELPSGDPLVTFRVVVDRPAKRGRTTATKRTRTVDSIDVACWSATARRAAGTLCAGDTVEVEGALRRRFWRAQQGSASRYEVEASRVRRPRVSVGTG